MKLIRIVVFLCAVVRIASGQQTQVIPWTPPANDAASRTRVYHPEPILFVHGVNANDKGWHHDDPILGIGTTTTGV